MVPSGFMLNFCRLNIVTKKDVHPLPRIDDALDTLTSSRWFSMLDLASGYWQVKMDPADREKTAYSVRSASISSDASV